MNTDDIEPRAILDGIPLFADVLGEEQLETLAAKCHFAVFGAGTEMMVEGDFGSSMFAIVTGAVSVTIADRRGTEHGVARLGPGDIVGEMSLMTGARRNATVVAESDVVALEITKVALEQILARAPDLIDRFGGMLATRQAELDRVAAKAAHADDLIGQIRHFFLRR
jgi:CRP/FNR family cyclic AMP-dependent transcriptional regulator